MPIERIGITEPPAPISSRAVVCGGKVYLGGIRAADAGPDIVSQTRAALKRVENGLLEVGSNKHSILTVQIWITDMSDFADMNAVWNEWVVAEQPPLRACVRGELCEAGALVEFVVVALR
ncbi:RidA family protein [Allopusillimonas ginsengisoli]|uniref:RidA family protein n=1 Tax=Allopusillimonas ginsengisoli TaxID=453575 RepID=UPI003CC8CF03